MSQDRPILRYETKSLYLASCNYGFSKLTALTINDLQKLRVVTTTDIIGYTCENGGPFPRSRPTFWEKFRKQKNHVSSESVFI
jgi:hypothetical protein